MKIHDAEDSCARAVDSSGSISRVVGNHSGFLPRLPLVGFSIVASGALVLYPVSAHAFRTAADDPQFAGTAKVRWAQDLIVYEINDQLPPGVTQTEVDTVLPRALKRWSEPAGSGVLFSFDRRISTLAVAGDGRNTIQYLASGWSARGYDPTAAGLTDVQYAKNDQGQWEIVEADMYLNGENHQWVASGATADDRRDLESVLTHESGHMLGLFHPCEVAGAHGAPDCTASPGFAQATMYPIYRAAQAQLSTDDVAGVLFLYPARPPCVHPGACGPGCAQDAECAAGQTCSDGHCAGAAVDGDPCAVPTECASGICTPDGYCITSCQDCASGVCEDFDGGATKMCTGSKLPMGATCSSPDACLGGECLTGADVSPVCTRKCNAGSLKCPASWACDTVEGQGVCRPVRVGAAGGCAITSLTNRSRFQMGLLMMGVVYASRRAARRCRARFSTYRHRSLSEHCAWRHR